jgi:hypothetical protein
MQAESMLDDDNWMALIPPTGDLTNCQKLPGTPGTPVLSMSDCMEEAKTMDQRMITAQDQSLTQVPHTHLRT